MREVLEALDAGELDVDAAEAALAGYVTTDAGRFDATRERRRGIPEAILAEGKTGEEVASLANTAVESTGRALVTRLEAETAALVAAALPEDVTVERNDRTRTLVARTPDFEPPTLDATVAVVTGGTSDAPVAGEAVVVARELGAETTLVEDVGVANLTRLVDQLSTIRGADVVVAAAGREGALATVVAGLVDAPVIGLPVSTGYGAGGDGEAALLGMLQSCTALSTVNVDAGYTAGAQAGLVAKAVSEGRTG